MRKVSAMTVMVMGVLAAASARAESVSIVCQESITFMPQPVLFIEASDVVTDARGIQKPGPTVVRFEMKKFASLGHELIEHVGRQPREFSAVRLEYPADGCVFAKDTEYAICDSRPGPKMIGTLRDGTEEELNAPAIVSLQIEESSRRGVFGRRTVTEVIMDYDGKNSEMGVHCSRQ